MWYELALDVAYVIDKLNVVSKAFKWHYDPWKGILIYDSHWYTFIVISFSLIVRSGEQGKLIRFCRNLDVNIFVLLMHV